jgi:hypothetical protein
MGLKSMISGPFFIGNLVDVGCRVNALLTAFGHTPGHTVDDRNVSFVGQLRDSR